MGIFYLVSVNTNQANIHGFCHQETRFGTHSSLCRSLKIRQFVFGIPGKWKPKIYVRIQPGIKYSWDNNWPVWCSLENIRLIIVVVIIIIIMTIFRLFIEKKGNRSHNIFPNRLLIVD